MAKGKCVVVNVTIDTGSVRKAYSLKPAPAADLPAPWAVGFLLTVMGETLSERYLVGLVADGSPRCTCPGFQSHGQCKHGAALVAAGLLPVRLVQLVAARDQLVNKAEAAALAKCEALAADAATDRAVWEHDRERMAEQVRQLEADLAAVTDAAARAQRAAEAWQSGWRPEPPARKRARKPRAA